MQSLDFDDIAIPLPEQPQKHLEAALAATPMRTADRERYVSDVPGEPDAPTWLANSRWGTGAAAGGPVAVTLCKLCPKRDSNEIGCTGSVPMAVLYVDGDPSRPNPKFCVCPDYPRRLVP